MNTRSAYSPHARFHRTAILFPASREPSKLDIYIQYMEKLAEKPDFEEEIRKKGYHPLAIKMRQLLNLNKTGNQK